MSKSSATDPEAAVERIRELNEQVLSFGKEAGVSFLEAYEDMVKTFADYQDKAADSTQVEWLSQAAKAQADFTRSLSKLYADSAREMLK
jgi:hypothetical protein